MRLDLYEQGGYASGGISEIGGNITGPLLLAGNPSQTLEAVPKQYVDAYFNSINASNLTGGTLPAARLPGLIGDLQTSQGASVFTLADSGVTPGSYGKVTVNAKGIVTSGGNLTDADIPFGVDWSKINSNTLPTTLSGYGILDGVSSTRGTLTGFLTLSQSPTLSTHAATKQYVDSLVSGGGIVVGDILRKPYSTTPAGFLKCNGSEVDKTTYANLYAVIGDNFAQNSMPGSGKPWQQQYQINTTQSTDITGWTTGSSLPGLLSWSQAVVTKNRVYLLGGWGGSGAVANVYTAPINEDGTLGTWTTGTSLPSNLYGAQAIVTKNRVYLLGGTNGTNYTTTTYTAIINSDGTIGSWSTATPLPGGLSGSQAIVTKNRVYLLGGYNGTVYTNIIYTAVINSDGTLGGWSTDGALPDSLNGSQAIVTKNRVYLLGGYNGTASTNIVYTAPISADGILGTWSAGTSLPGALAGSQAIVTKNRVYLLGGGVIAGASVSTVYTAPINTDGTLGSWVIGTPLPVNLSNSQVILTKNRIHLLGGGNGFAIVNTVYTASISEGLNDYSPYYDGTIVPNTDTTKFLLPDFSSDEPFGSYSYIKY